MRKNLYLEGPKTSSQCSEFHYRLLCTYVFLLLNFFFILVEFAFG